MSIATAITNAQGRVADCYTAISNKGGTLPATQNLANMPTAIGSIPAGGTIDSLTVTPTTSQQTITATGGVDGYSPITVNAVTSSIDSNISAGNIKSGVSILGVSGSVTELKGETRSVSLTNSSGQTFTPTSGKNGITSITVTPNNQSRSVTPSTSSQTLNVNSGYSGNGRISVSAVTSSIDSNITAGNIKNGVSILGVTGTLNVGVTEVSTETEMNNNLTSENLGRVFLYTGTTTSSYTNGAYYVVSAVPSTDTFTIDLNPSNYAFQSSSVLSLDQDIYIGPYESTNYHVASSYAVAKITTNAREFSVWINSYAESSFDYTIISKLDASTFPTSYSGALVKESTRSFQKDPTTFSTANWKKVTYNSTDGLDGNSHFVWVVYRKDSSSDSNNDRGYFVVEKSASYVYEKIGPANLTTKTITVNGTYNASSDNADGYSSVTVNVGGGATLITKTITTNGTYNASSDNADGYSSVTVNVPGYKEMPSYQVSEQGVASRKSKTLDGNEFSNITSIDSYGLAYAFYHCTGLTGTLNLSSLSSIASFGLREAFSGCTGLTGALNLSSLSSVDQQGLYNAFGSCSGLTSIDLSSLSSIGDYGLYSAFGNCQGLTSIDLSSLSSVGSNGLAYAFGGAGLTSIDLSSLSSVGISGLSNTFSNCRGLTNVDLSSLSSVDSSGLYYAFSGCTGLTNVYFNSLTTSSFGSYTNQFSSMLINTGKTKTHTLHFPSNLSSKISTLSGYPLFGGTSGYVTLSFDLPATS